MLRHYLCSSRITPSCICVCYMHHNIHIALALWYTTKCEHILGRVNRIQINRQPNKIAANSSIFCDGMIENCDQLTFVEPFKISHIIDCSKVSNAELCILTGYVPCLGRQHVELWEGNLSYLWWKNKIVRLYTHPRLSIWGRSLLWYTCH